MRFEVKSMVRSAILLALVPVMIAGCGGSSPESTEQNNAANVGSGDDVASDLIEKAAAEKTLTIYQDSFGDPNMWAEIEQGIKKRWGISVSLNAQLGPSISTVVSKLQEEHKAGHPPSSDIIKASSLHTVPLGDEGALLDGDWLNTCPGLPKETVTKGGSLIMGAEFVTAVMNTNLIPLEDAPKDYADLADPRFKGLVATTPYSGSWAQIGVAMGGVDKLVPILQEITKNGNLAGFISQSDTQRVASGEFGILVSGGEEDVKKLKESGAPVEGVQLGRLVANTYMYEVLAGTKSPNLAKLVGCYIMSPDGQDTLYKFQRYDSPYIEGNVAYKRFQEAEASGEEPLVTTPELYRENLDAFVDFAENYAELVGSR